MKLLPATGEIDMELYYEDKADLLIIRFSEKDYGCDIEIADGKGVMTMAKDGSLQEIQIFEASTNGSMVLSTCNLNIGQAPQEAVFVSTTPTLKG